MVRTTQKFNCHGLLSAMILHGNHGGVRGISFTASFQSHLVVEFQWQAGNQNGVLQACKLHYAGFSQTRRPTAQRGHLYGQANGRNSRKKSCQLFRAALLIRDKRRLVKPSHVASPVLDRILRGLPQRSRRTYTKESPGKRSTPGTKKISGRFPRITNNQWQLRFGKMAGRLIRLRLQQICLSLAFVVCNKYCLLRHRLRLVNVRFMFHRDVVAFEFAIQRCATDAQHLPRECLVAVGLFEDPENRHSLHFR